MANETGSARISPLTQAANERLAGVPIGESVSDPRGKDFSDHLRRLRGEPRQKRASRGRKTPAGLGSSQDEAAELAPGAGRNQPPVEPPARPVSTGPGGEDGERPDLRESDNEPREEIPFEVFMSQRGRGEPAEGDEGIEDQPVTQPAESRSNAVEKIRWWNRLRGRRPQAVSEDTAEPGIDITAPAAASSSAPVASTESAAAEGTAITAAAVTSAEPSPAPAAAAAQERPVNRPGAVPNPLSFLDDLFPPEPAAGQPSSPEKPSLDLSQTIDVGGSPEEIAATAERAIAAIRRRGPAGVEVTFVGAEADLRLLDDLLAKANIAVEHPKAVKHPNVVGSDDGMSITATFSSPTVSEPVSGEPGEVPGPAAEPAGGGTERPSGPQSAELKPGSPDWPIRIGGKSSEEIKSEVRQRMVVVGVGEGALILSEIPDPASRPEEYERMIKGVKDTLGALGINDENLDITTIRSERIAVIPIPGRLEAETPAAAEPAGGTAGGTGAADETAAAAESSGEPAQPAETDTEVAEREFIEDFRSVLRVIRNHAGTISQQEAELEARFLVNSVRGGLPTELTAEASQVLTEANEVRVESAVYIMGNISELDQSDDIAGIESMIRTSQSLGLTKVPAFRQRIEAVLQAYPEIQVNLDEESA